MKDNKVEYLLSKMIALSGFLVTIAVVTWGVNEPVNAPKMLLLGMFSFCVLFFVIHQRRHLNLHRNPFLLAGLGVFLLSALISIFYSESSIVSGFYGIFGRNTGFLTYACLAILFFSSTLLSSPKSVTLVINAFFYSGVVNVVYFVFTQFNIELLAWNNEFDRILGTFGNPNFVGSFMGMFVILCTVLVFKGNQSTFHKIFLFILIAVSLYEIKMSLAVQGIVITLAGWAIITFYYLRAKRVSNLVLALYSVAVSVVGIISIGGALQKGPLAEIIYKTSVSLRGEYWYAGIQMGLNHPFVGVGMDSYGSWYRRMRSESSITLPGPETTSDAAHNVFIDFFASGGFPLVFAYLVLTGVVLVQIFRGLRQSKDFDWIFVALTTMWLAYQAQSLISINQIGLAIWGWILSGLIIGYVGRENIKINSNKLIENTTKGRNVSLNQKPVNVNLAAIGFVIGGLVAGPPMIADAKWHASLKLLDPVKLESNSRLSPIEPIRLLQASTIYTRSGMPSKGLEIAKFATELFPNNYYAWQVFMNTPGISENEKIEALKQLRRLDPLNPAYN